MKKLICIILAIFMLTSAFMITSCDTKDETVVSDNSIETISQSKIAESERLEFAETADANEYPNGGETIVMVVATGVTLDKNAVQLSVGDTSTLTSIVAPVNATDKSVTWSSSDKSVVTVENGKLTAVGEGTATVTTRTSNGKSATCSVIVVSNGIGFLTLQTDGTTVSGNVSNNTTNYSFADEITTSGRATYKITYDIEGTQTVDKVTLAEGDNVFYVHMTIDNDTTVYNVTIHRREMYTVTFNAKGGMAVESQTVEEDGYATEPTTERTGYTFVEWDYDFTQPITQNTTVNAKWTSNPCTVTYDANGGIISTATKILGYEQEYTLDEPTPFLGYVFDGWYYGKEKIAANGSSWRYHEDITITAKWEVISEMSDFIFTSTATECTITGVKDETKTSYIIPNYVTSIGYDAFQNCSSLTSITIPDSVTSIGMYAFQYCYNLTSITMSNSVTSIGDCAFSWCYKLVEVINYSSFTFTIGSSDYGRIAFYAKEVHTGTSKIVNKNDYLFYTCDGINYLLGYVGTDTELVLPDDYNGEDYEIYDYAFCVHYDITSVTIPDSVTSIGDGTFARCYSLTSVTIPDSVTSIGSGALNDCYKLVEVINHSSLTFTVGSEDYGYIARYAKEVHTGTSKIVNKNEYLFYMYNGVNYLLGYTGTDTELVLPDNYNGEDYEIYQYAFYERDDITRVTIPDSVTSIGGAAFYCCDSLTSITIPNSVTSIGSLAFSGCIGLASVTIGNGLTSIGSYFSGCSNLTSITIGENVTSIDKYAFEYTHKLVEVINHSSLNITVGSSDYGWIAYDAKEVHKGTSKIVNKDDYLFYMYNGVNYLLGYVGTDTELVLPENYNGEGYEIYKYAFYRRDDITSVTISDGVTSIGDYAFYYCDSLTSVTIGNSVTNICSSAFSACDSLTSITIGNSVTSIGSYAFSGSDGLTSITIPDNVTSIAYRAFYDCSNLTSVIFENTSVWWELYYTSVQTYHVFTGLDPSSMAKYLTSTYSHCDWERYS